jgi:hypothetical protein
MVTLKYSVLRSDVFRVAMVKLANCQMDTDKSKKLLDLCIKLEQELKKSQVEWQELLKPACKVEDNHFMMNEDKTDFAWLDGVDPNMMRAKIMEFANKDVNVEDFERLEIELTDGKFSPLEIAALDAIVSISTKA